MTSIQGRMAIDEYGTRVFFNKGNKDCLPKFEENNEVTAKYLGMLTALNEYRVKGPKPVFTLKAEDGVRLGADKLTAGVDLSIRLADVPSPDIEVSPQHRWVLSHTELRAPILLVGFTKDQHKAMVQALVAGYDPVEGAASEQEHGDDAVGCAPNIELKLGSKQPMQGIMLGAQYVPHVKGLPEATEDVVLYYVFLASSEAHQQYRYKLANSDTQYRMGGMDMLAEVMVGGVIDIINAPGPVGDFQCLMLNRHDALVPIPIQIYMPTLFKHGLGPLQVNVVKSLIDAGLDTSTIFLVSAASDHDLRQVFKAMDLDVGQVMDMTPEVLLEHLVKLYKKHKLEDSRNSEFRIEGENCYYQFSGQFIDAFESGNFDEFIWDCEENDLGLVNYALLRFDVFKVGHVGRAVRDFNPFTVLCV